MLRKLLLGESSCLLRAETGVTKNKKTVNAKLPRAPFSKAKDAGPENSTSKGKALALEGQCALRREGAVY